MQEDIEIRVLKEAYYIIQTGDTVRKTARIFLVSKSTVHKDVTKRLKKIDKELYLKVKLVLARNLSERHIRGGEATKRKFIKEKTVDKKAILH